MRVQGQRSRGALRNDGFHLGAKAVKTDIQADTTGDSPKTPELDGESRECTTRTILKGANRLHKNQFLSRRSARPGPQRQSYRYYRQCGCRISPIDQDWEATFDLIVAVPGIPLGAELKLDHFPASGPVVKIFMNCV